MSNSLAKKVFAVGGIVAMAISAVPMTALAAAHSAGINISSSDGTVWMVMPDGTRRAYTSAGAFLSYGFNSWSTVVAANAEDLALPVGAFIPPQDGKIFCATETKGSDVAGECALVTGGMKAAFVSEPVFTGLGFSFSRAQYGDSSFLSKSSNVESATEMHRPGVLVNNGGTVQLIGSAGLLGIPDLATFNTWGYSFADVVPANTADKTLSQTGVMASRLPGQLSPTATTGGGTTPPPTTGTISASLASDTPAASVFASGSSYNNAAKYTLTNSSSSAVNVTQITITRGGIVQDSNVTGVAIFDSTGRRHGNFGTFGTAKSTIGFAADPIVVPASGSTTIWVKLNLNSAATTGTVAVGIAQASDLVTGGTVGGSFPLWGNTHSIVSGSGVIGAATLQVQTLTGGTAASPAQVDLGLTNFDVTKFRVAETSGQEDLKLSSITIFNNGTAADGDYTNVTLKDQTNAVLGTVAKATSGRVQFVMTAPYVVPRGATRDFIVAIDIPGVANSASRTMDFTVQNDYDIELYGSQTNSGILPTAASLNNFPVGDGVDVNGATATGEVSNHIQFKTGSITVSKSNASPSSKLAPGSTNATLAEFEIKAFGEDIELQRLTFVVTDDGSTQILAGRRSLSGTLKVNDENGGSLYSVTASTGTLYHTTGVTVSSNAIVGSTDGSAATGTQVTLNTYKTVKAGTTSKLVFVSDIPSTATSVDAFAIQLEGYYARRVSTNNYITNTAVVAGNVRQVDTTSLSVSKNSSYNPTNLVKGGSGLKIASYNVQAGPAENLTLTNLGLEVCTNTDGSATIVCTTSSVPAGVSNIMLKVNGTAFGTPISSTTANTIETFSGSAAVNASSTAVVDVFADISSAFQPDPDAVPATPEADYLSTELSVNAAVGQQSQTNVTATAQRAQDILMTANGTLRLEADAAGTPIQQIVRAAQTGVPLLTLKVSESGNAEDIKLSKLFFAATLAAGDFTNLSLWDGSTQVGSNASLVNVGSLGGGELKFSNLNLNITKGASAKVLTLKGDSNSSGVQVVGQRSLFAPTHYEYQGVNSGTTVRVSGGMTTATAIATALTFTVTDGSQFVVGNKVAVDMNADGDVADTDETKSGAGYTISGISGNTITISDVGGLVSAITVIGGKVIAFDATGGAGVLGRLNFSSQMLINHNSEPVVAVDSSASTGSNGSSNQPIATFNISAGGTRDVTISALQFKFTGSFVSAGAGAATSCLVGGIGGTDDGGVFAVQVWQNAQNQAGTLFRTTTAGGATTCFGSGETASFLFTSPITISAGSSTPTQFVIKGNTSLTRANLTTSGTISYGVYLDGIAGKGQITGGTVGTTVDTAQTLGGVFWDYTDVNGIYGSTGTTTAGVVPVFTSANASTAEVMDVTDYYPVNGPVINY